MFCPTELRLGLKEWASVCHAMQCGRQIILLRKGGIQEVAGEFELEHREFILYPTFSHQNPTMVKPQEQSALSVTKPEPQTIHLSAAGVVTDIYQVKMRSQMDHLDDQHIWTAPLIDIRFNYRPTNPLYLLLVRIFQLRRPVDLENTPSYAGCKSWVPLEEWVDSSHARPVLDDQAYEQRRQQIRGVLGLN